ncbi:MAG: response regulator [Bacteroidales bacterium]|nr:response regulator [Bacteroidales bacterium]
MEEKITILYVDDEFINLQVFIAVLKKKFNIITASSGMEALEILENNNKIKIVISDMQMPEMNGMEFINHARKKNYEVIYFIFTGFEISDEITEALKNKIIKNYFRKPIDKDVIEKSLLKEIDKLVN